MPILRADAKLIFYAHVPKCAGSSVEQYLSARFGTVAFADRRYFAQTHDHRWSRTSPQHIARADLDRLFPPAFFDHSFAIVRHPVARAVSAFHFQLEHERSLPQSMDFSDWVEQLPELLETDPFAYDNHIRPMDDLVPEAAAIFHIEHGIDAIVPWFDAVTETQAAPRALPIVNDQSGRGSTRAEVTPTDYMRLAEIYAADFARFGYSPETAEPHAPAPELPPEIIAARDAERKRAQAPLARLRGGLRRALKP